MSVIYLDMDGVIADFFGGIEALYNVDHWKSIKDKENTFYSKKLMEKHSDRICYCHEYIGQTKWRI